LIASGRGGGGWAVPSGLSPRRANSTRSRPGVRSAPGPAAARTGAVGELGDATGRLTAGAMIRWRNEESWVWKIGIRSAGMGGSGFLPKYKDPGD